MQCIVAINPTPAPRPRFRVIGKFASAYMPAAYKNWKAEAVDLLRPHVPRTPYTGPLSLLAEFVVQRPKTTKLATPGGDIDNYLKSLMDALTEVGAWEDDKQVVTVKATKRWGAPGEEGSIGLVIKPC